MAATALSNLTSQLPSSGGRLVALDGRPLPLQGTELRVRATGGLARVVLEQLFRNVHAEPLRALYQLPLPADGAVSGFAFRIGPRRVVGEVDRKAAARERFEAALVEGRTAALLEQDRSSLFSQEIGNIPPGSEVVAEIEIDQRLRWLDEGAWEWRFPTAVAPRYAGGEGMTPDGARAAVTVADPKGAPIEARARLRLEIGDRAVDAAAVASASHALSVTGGAAGLLVSLAGDGAARLDRDLVVAWPVAAERAALALATFRAARKRSTNAADGAYGLLTLVPPRDAFDEPALPRELVVLLDTSGSMSGEPLAQAKAVVGALIASLRDEDRLELIEFSTEPRRWKRGLVAATARARGEALEWLGALEAGGATEMVKGILAAMTAARSGAQRQVVLVTDGLIGFEEKVVREILRHLPGSTRFHTVGVGSSVNRTLTAGAARAGRGAEVIVGCGEDPKPAAARLLARTSRPLVTQLEVSGTALLEHAPAALPDLFAGAPVLLSLQLRPGGGQLAVRGRWAGGVWDQRLEVPAVESGQGEAAVAALFGREKVEDLEARAAAGEREGIDAEIERLGLAFQIATRLTSWVAISEQPSVDPGAPMLRERMPHELADGISAEGLGLRHVVPVMYRAAQAQPPIPAAMAFKALDSVRFCMAPQAERPRDIQARMAGPDSGSGPPQPFFDEMDAWRASGVLLARIVLRDGRKLVLELELPELMEWAPGGRVALLLGSGETVDAAVDAVHSTQPARIAAGRTVRLVLEAAEEIGDRALRAVLAEIGGRPFSIQVSP